MEEKIFEQMNSELEKLRQDIGRLRKLDTMLSDLNRQLSDHKQLAVSLKKTLEKENLDVEKISKTSITSLFHTILGNREQQMEKEYQEALAAKLKLDQCQYEVQGIQSRISQLNQERMEYSDCEQRYSTLLQKKHDMLLLQHGKRAEEIVTLERNILSCHSNRKEIDEAECAGNDVLRGIQRITDSLNKAENWGTWDLLGGGLISDLQKHSHIDNAQAEAANVGILLSRFHSELADVKITSNLNIEIDGFSKFADFFFDGLIADWVVQSKIHDSQASVEQLERQVHSVLSRLAEIKRQNSETEKKLHSQLTEVIAKA